MDQQCFVYWLYDESCADIHAHGYVGASVDPARRAAVHRYRGRLPDFKLTVVFSGTREECLAKEKELRPVPGIGWNIEPGGPRRGVIRPAVSEMNKQRWETVEHREKMKAVCSGNRWGSLVSKEGRARAIAASCTPEANRKKGEVHVGNKYRVGKAPGIKGKCQSEAAREKMRAAWVIRRARQNGILASAT